MKKSFINIIILLVLLFIIGGFTVFFQGVDVIIQIFVGFFPIFKPTLKKSIEDYLTSAYFIVGLIVFIASLFGIIISCKTKKVMYIIISIIVELISLISILSNLI